MLDFEFNFELPWFILLLIFDFLGLDICSILIGEVFGEAAFGEALALRYLDIRLLSLLFINLFSSELSNLSAIFIYYIREFLQELYLKPILDLLLEECLISLFKLCLILCISFTSWDVDLLLVGL